MKALSSALMLVVATAAITTMASPLSLRGTPPPPIGGDLTWCTTNPPGKCTLGIRQNFGTDEIDAYMFDYDCKLLNSTNDLVTDSTYLFVWPGPQGYPQAGSIYVEDITGEGDIFLFDGTVYQHGWSWEDHSPIWYEYRSFECGAAGKNGTG